MNFKSDEFVDLLYLILVAFLAVFVGICALICRMKPGFLLVNSARKCFGAESVRVLPVDHSPLARGIQLVAGILR